MDFYNLAKLAVSGTELTDNNREVCSRNVVLSLSGLGDVCFPTGYFYGQQVFQVTKGGQGESGLTPMLALPAERVSWARPQLPRECGGFSGSQWSFTRFPPFPSSGGCVLLGSGSRECTLPPTPGWSPLAVVLPAQARLPASRDPSVGSFVHAKLVLPCQAAGETHPSRAVCTCLFFPCSLMCFLCP